MGNSRRGLAAGVNFIWDLPMTLLVKISNIHRHRGRETSLSKAPQFNSIRVRAHALDFDGAARCGRCLIDAALSTNQLIRRPGTTPRDGWAWLPAA